MKIGLSKKGFKVKCKDFDSILDLTNPLNTTVQGIGIESDIKPVEISPFKLSEQLCAAGQAENQANKLDILKSVFDEFI